uniref:Uncharacterized protein n=1 Tax=Homalodisca liturata TaxID=320908 RepID=A0A1B6H5F9_9HEMI
MKCPRKSSMPSGIQHWLEEQLEARGFDAAIYSKYILSVLCNSSSDLPIKPKDPAVKTLIDELSANLKGIQAKGLFPPSELARNKNLEEEQPQSSPEKPYRYYSAFPSQASKSKTDQTCSSVGSSSSIWSGKRVFGSCIGKNRTFSEGNNRDSKFNSFIWLEEDKENNGCNRDAKEKMRSRSTVKQQTPEKVYRNMAKSLDRKDDLYPNSEMSKSRRLYQQSNELANECTQALWSTEKSYDDLSGCDQDLPMDFQQLLESPEASKSSFDYSRCVGTKQPSSFIQCGTNITSSIWSEKAEDTIDCSMIGETSIDLNFNKSVWNTSNETSLNRPEILKQSGSCLKSNIWSTTETNVFSDNSWKAVGNNDTKECSGEFGKWSDIENTSLLLNDSDSYFSAIGSNLHGSLTALNHNKEDSSFTEVIPKVPSIGLSITKDSVNVEPVVTRNESRTSKKEEEDLLTSMRTHFRPIKQETVEVFTSTIAPTYPDGTTFPISSNLDKPNFHRSHSGGLYLDSDMNKKYMEFTDAEDDNPSEFVPKFRVDQNEKFCQTEEFLMPPQSYVEEADRETMFFPEDENLVRKMVEEDEEEEEENTFWSGDACIKVDGFVATWPASIFWNNKPNVQKIWCGENLWNTAGGSGVDNPGDVDAGGGGGGDQYTQLRNEWTQEAEELFSDISQQLYRANYIDTQPTKLGEEEPKESETTVVVRGVSRNRKRRHWSSQLGANCQLPRSRGLSLSRPLTL